MKKALTALFTGRCFLCSGGRACSMIRVFIYDCFEQKDVLSACHNIQSRHHHLGIAFRKIVGSFLPVISIPFLLQGLENHLQG